MTEKASTKISFLVSETFSFFVFVIVLAGAEDILAGTHLQTSNVLLADSLPFFHIAVFFPYVASRIPYIVRFVFIVFLCLVAFSILGFVSDVNLKVFGVALASFGNGILSVSILGLTSYFNPEVLWWYSAGTGIGSLLGLLYYVALTTWLCLSPQITLFVLGPCSLVILMCYFFIQKEITKHEQQRNCYEYHQLESEELKDKEKVFINSVKSEKENEFDVSKKHFNSEKYKNAEFWKDKKGNISAEPEKEKGVKKKIFFFIENDKEEKQKNSETKKQRTRPLKKENNEKEALFNVSNEEQIVKTFSHRDNNNILTFDRNDELTVFEKLTAVKRLFIEVGFASLVTFFSKFLVFQSVITTLAYQSSPFPPRDHFQYYSLALMIGEVLGRSHRGILVLIRPKCLYTPTRFLLCSLALLELSHMAVLFLESWYRFFPGITISIILCLSCGFVAGIVFVNCLELVRCSFEGQAREFAISMAYAPMNLGILSASLVGLLVEPVLKHHCIDTKANAEYCFTRASSLHRSVSECEGLI